MSEGKTSEKNYFVRNSAGTVIVFSSRFVVMCLFTIVVDDSRCWK